MKAVNLIPSEQRAGGGPAAGESEGAAFLVLGLLGGLVVLALLYGMASHDVSSRKDKVASVNAQAQATQARANALAPYTSFKAMYEQRRSAVSDLVNTRFDWAHAFHELGRVVPKDASLNSVKGTIGSGTGTTGAAAPAPSASATSSAASAGSSVTSATPPGSIPTFVIAGCATSQTEVAQTLQRMRLIDGVSGVTLQSSTKSTSGGSSGSGGCPGKDPAFAMTVTFAALPAASAAGSAASGTSAQSAAASTPATPSTSAASAGGAQ